MAETDLARPAFRYSSAGRRPERLNQSRNVNAPLQLARGWAAGLLGLPGDIEGLVRLLPGLDETPRLPTSDFYREYLPGYDERPAARAMSGLGALTGGAGATGVVRGGLGAVKRATDLNAIRDYVRATQGLSGLPGTAVVKPRGGNWISGAGSPEEAVRALKVREEPIAIPMDDAEMAAYRAQGYTRYDPETGALSRPNPINQWIDQKLAKYIRNEMGTPEDPLRALIQERGVSHLPLETLQEGAEWLPETVEKARRAGGYPEEGMALQRHAAAGYPEGLPEEYTRAAQGWEAATDAPLGTTLAGELLSPDTVGADVLGSRRDIADMYLRENPWLAKVPPETPVYSIEGITQADLGFSHLIDELRNAVREGSDLPRELQLRPEQLSKVSMPQAVELVDRINKWRAAQKAEADLTRSTNVATQTFKEYPEQGYKWVELKAPEDVKVDRKAILGDEADNPYGPPEESLASEVRYRALQDALKYEGETMGHCVGGYCPDVMEGRSRIFSLRDAKGQPHVTVEVKPSPLTAYDAWYSKRSNLKEPDPEYQEFLDFLQSEKPADIKGEGVRGLEKWYRQWAEQTGRKIEEPPPEIVQIKGKGNRAPKDDYLPYVQDFVKSQRWGRIGDAQNTGMRQTREVFNFNELQMLKRLGEDYIPDVLTGEDIQRLHNMIVPEGRRLKYDARGNVVGSEEPGYARGGMVSAAGGGPAQYDPAHINALVEELLMEA